MKRKPPPRRGAKAPAPRPSRTKLDPVAPDPAARAAPRRERKASAPEPPVLVAEPSTDELPPEPPSEVDVGARIRELEDRLDLLIDARVRERESQAELDDGVPTRRTSAPPPGSPEPFGPSAFAGPESGIPFAPPSRPPPDRPSAPPEADGMLGTARELLSTDFYLRKWGRMGLRNRSEEVDEFGYDPVYEQRALPFFEFLYSRYFRVEVHGAARVPAEGRCLLVANHSGTLPFDGMMLRLAVSREHPSHRAVRWLAEDSIFHFPFLGSFANRLGAVRACPENAERLLDQGSLVAVFPEGMKGIGKLYRNRYRLQRFGRGGFVKLALRTRTPIIPVAILGAEETNPMLARVEYLTRAIGLPYLPITPTFPALGPLGLLPAPTKWKIFFGEPISMSEHGPQAAEDEMLVGRLTGEVRGAIQAMLDWAVGERRSVWFG